MSLTYKSVAQISRKPESSSIKFPRRTFSPGYHQLNKNCMDDFPPLKVHFQKEFLTNNNNDNNNNEKYYNETRLSTLNQYNNNNQHPHQCGPSSSSSTTNKITYSECLLAKKAKNSTLQNRENPHHQTLCSSKLYNSQTVNVSEKTKNSELIEFSNNNIAFKQQVYPSSLMEIQKPINSITKTKSEEKFNLPTAENLINTKYQNNIYHSSNSHIVGIENFGVEFLKRNNLPIAHETENTFLPEIPVNKIEEPKCIKGRSVHTINNPNYLGQKNVNFNSISTLNNNPRSVLPSESIFPNNWYLQENLSNQFGFNKIFNKMTPIFEEGNMYAEIYGHPTVSSLGIFNNLTPADKPILKGKKDFKARFLPYRRAYNNVQNDSNVLFSSEKMLF